MSFLRPRMGIGGSERLVTDAAIELKRRGHSVTLFVPDRGDVAQFPALLEHGITFQKGGAFLPSHIVGRLRAPLAIARTAWAAWRMNQQAALSGVVFSDVVPHVIPFVKHLTGMPVLYFCHFPDLLLTPEGGRDSASYRAYRRPLDRIEERGVASADLVVTNSRFTASIVRSTFPSVSPDRMTVLYPGVPVPAAAPSLPEQSGDSEILILSVNRFDPRKNLALAIDALGALRRRLAAGTFRRVRLVLAGHYDRRLPEAVALVEDLRLRAESAGLSEHVRLVFSPTESEREKLLALCRCVVYTPTAEHFGYVPIEAMAAGRPVVAVNNGGPAETVLDGTTGFLADPVAEAFGVALAALVEHAETAAALGCAGHSHVARHFSLDAFGASLESLVTRLALTRTRGRTSR